VGSVKKLVLPENKSVNDLRVIDGIRGDDAIEPGAPPACGGFCATPLPPPPEVIGIFGTSKLRFLRLLLFLGFGINYILFGLNDNNSNNGKLLLLQ